MLWAVGATIYFGSDESTRQLQEVARAFEYAHELGMATILWCYLQPGFKKDGVDYHVSADLTGQANHLGVTIEADIIKQKLPENNGGYLALNTKGICLRQNDKRIYTELTTDHPLTCAATRWPLLLYGQGRTHQLRRCIFRCQ